MILDRILKMTFSTSKSAENAVTHLKNWNESLDVKIDPRSREKIFILLHFHNLIIFLYR